MKKRLVLFSLLFGIVLINFLSAISTNIVVNTAPNYSIMARVYEVGGTQPVTDSVYVTSNEKGVSIINFELSIDDYDLEMWLRDPTTGSYNLRHERFEESYPAGVDFEMNFYPDWYPIEDIEKINSGESLSNETTAVNETVVQSPVILADAENETVDVPEDTTLINETSSKKGILTALSISDGTLFKNKNFFYYVAGIIVLAALFIFFFKYRKYRKENPREYKSVKVVKLSELKNPPQQYNAGDIKNQEDKIEQAKKMIQEAEGELKRLKSPNVDKIEQAKRKLIEDEKELMRLRRESKND